MNPCEYSLNVEGWYDNIGKLLCLTIVCELPSGNQTWHLKIMFLLDDFPTKISI